jgi:hypothetical protein
MMLDETVLAGRATSDAVAWLCACGKDQLPLVATPRLVTVCPKCERRYKFTKDAGHRHGGHVDEIEIYSEPVAE